MSQCTPSCAPNRFCTGPGFDWRCKDPSSPPLYLMTNAVKPASREIPEQFSSFTRIPCCPYRTVPLSNCCTPKRYPPVQSCCAQSICRQIDGRGDVSDCQAAKCVFNTSSPNPCGSRSLNCCPLQGGGKTPLQCTCQPTKEWIAGGHCGCNNRLQPYSTFGLPTQFKRIEPYWLQKLDPIPQRPGFSLISESVARNLQAKKGLDECFCSRRQEEVARCCVGPEDVAPKISWNPKIHCVKSCCT